MLAPGKYYVGDLCYVLGDKNGYRWMDVLDTTGYLGCYVPGTREPIDRDETTGYFHYNGVKFFSSSTAYGDGCYRDAQGREYGVDAGLIGCFPLDALGLDPQQLDGLDGGHVIEFDHQFSCHVCDDDGVISMGPISISTAEAEDEYYEDDPEDDYWDDENGYEEAS